MEKKIMYFTLFSVLLLSILSGCIKNKEISYNPPESKDKEAAPIRTQLEEKLVKIGDLNANALAVFDNTMYVGTAGDGVYRIEQGAIKPSDTTLGTIRTFAIYDGKFYAGGDKGIFVLSGDKWKNASKPPDVKSDYGNVVWQIMNYNNTLYVIKGEIFKGGKLFKLVEGTWVNISEKTFYEVIFYENNLYAGGYQGVYVFKNDEWIRLSTGDSTLVSDFIEYQNELYVGVENKIFKIQDTDLINIKSLYSPPRGYKFGIHDDKLYITTSDGIQVILSDNVWILLKSKVYPVDYLQYNNELYLATEEGVFKYYPDNRVFNSVIVGGRYE